jgi:hypothetical protein
MVRAAVRHREEAMRAKQLFEDGAITGAECKALRQKALAS